MRTGGRETEERRRPRAGAHTRQGGCHRRPLDDSGPGVPRPGPGRPPPAASDAGTREEVGAPVTSHACVAGPSGVQRERGTPWVTPWHWEDR